MAETRAWLVFLGPGEHPSAGVVVDTLARAGVSTRPFDPAVPTGPGIVFFTEVTAGLTEFLRGASQGGRERILAVAAAPAALPTSTAWALLRDGAADVLASGPV